MLARAVRILAGKPFRFQASLPVVADAAPEGASPAKPEPDVVVIQDEDELDWFLCELCPKAIGYTIAIDEAHLYCDHPELTNLVRTMRHRQQDMWLVTQRVAHFPHAIISQLDKICVFHMWWEPDLKTMQERFQVEPDAVRALKIGEFIERDVSLGGTGQT